MVVMMVLKMMMTMTMKCYKALSVFELLAVRDDQKLNKTEVGMENYH